MSRSMPRDFAEPILTTLNEPYLLGHHRHTCTPSIGATLFTGLKHTSAEVLKQADLAMYAAKSKGRNNLHFFDESLLAAAQ